MDPRRGGMETSVKEFLAEATALGIDVQGVTLDAPRDFTLVPVHRLGTGGWGRAERYRRFVTRADEFVRQGDWDVVHAVTPCLACHLYQPRSGVEDVALARTVAARRPGPARLLRRVGAALNRKQRLLRRLEQQLLTTRPLPHVAALSQYMRRQLQAAYALPAERLHDVFNGVTVPLPEATQRAAIRECLRAQLGLTGAEGVALFVGHNFRRKGLSRVLEALARPEARDWRLIIAGKDSPGPYQRRAHQLGLSDRVQFLGGRPDVRELYIAADVCVLPTYYDPCSRTVLEALSLGVPCITTAYDGSAECIREGEQGVVLESPEAVDKLAEALRRLSDPIVRQPMSNRALALRPHLSMRRHAEQIAQVYECIVRERASSRC
jgi:UDP-glucose:(heptosyl)LPS alpha-1,3-glucosyltransferase